MSGILMKRRKLPEKEVRFYLSEIVLAVEKLHKVGTLLSAYTDFNKIWCTCTVSHRHLSRVNPVP
jgi:serine/threonine protein kinase